MKNYYPTTPADRLRGAYSRDTDDTRSWLNNAFPAAGFTFFTDDISIVRVPGVFAPADPMVPPVLEVLPWDVFDRGRPLATALVTPATLAPFATPDSCHRCHGIAPARGAEPCPECGGEGHICFYGRCGRHEYEAECRECNGSGGRNGLPYSPGWPDRFGCGTCYGTGHTFAPWMRVSLGFALDVRRLFFLVRAFGWIQLRQFQGIAETDPLPFVFPGQGQGFIQT
jgi:hypothetical protein